jgi:hypothetical protein
MDGRQAWSIQGSGRTLVKTRYEHIRVRSLPLLSFSH